MRKFKKILLCAAACLLLPVWAGAEDWYLSGVRVDTENAAEIDADALNRAGVLTLNEDGTAALTETDIGSLNGSWSEEEGVITLTGGDGTTLLLNRTEDSIERKVTGLVLVFTQVQASQEQAFTPPTAIRAEEATQFYGDWQARWCVAGGITVAMSDTGDSLGFTVNGQGVWLLRGEKQIACAAAFQDGVLALPDLGVALALDDDGSLSMVQGSLTFFLYPAE